MRMLRTLCAVLLVVAGGLLATSGTANASPSVTVQSAYLDYDGSVSIHGSATCSASGTGLVSVYIVQIFPFTMGYGETTFPCGTGPAGWTVWIPPGHHQLRSDQAGVTAFLYRDGVEETYTQQQWFWL